eukprot:scaffold2476_cov99-Skeletonema_marinoi.AAC.1
MQSSSPSAAAERREAHHKRRAIPLAINVYASLLDTCAYLRQRESQATISQTHTKKVDNGAHGPANSRARDILDNSRARDILDTS